MDGFERAGMSRPVEDGREVGGACIADGEEMQAAADGTDRDEEVAADADRLGAAARDVNRLVFERQGRLLPFDRGIAVLRPGAGCHYRKDALDVRSGFERRLLRLG